jgi:hypothetical protein
MKKSDLISLVREVVQVTEKKKGVDGKACWKGYRYAGTKNGKDICIKVKGVKEETEADSKITLISVIDGKRNLNIEQLRQIFNGDVLGTFYIYTNEEDEYENEKPISKQEALEYIKYYNSRIDGDSNTEERLGAKLGVLGIESELRFNHGEVKADPTVFSINEGPGKDYLDKTAKTYFQAKDFESSDPKPNPNDVALYIGETETDEIGEQEFTDWLEEGNYDTVKVAEYQFEESRYNFKDMRGAGEYDSATVIFKVIDKMNQQVLIPGNKGKKYPFLAATDRGALGDTYPLLEAEHVKILKSIADIFQPEDVYENYADGKVKGKSRPGRVKKSGASCNGSVTDLRKKAKNASGEKAKMYHWCANMKGGKK